MPTCPKCGAYNPDSYEFCSRCGEMMSPVEMGAPVSKRYTADRPALRYLLIILQIIPCVLGLYLLFGTRLDVTGSYGFFSDTMSIMEILGQGWYPTSISASGFTIIFWISAILFIVGLSVPVFHIFGYVMTLGMAMGMSEMYVFGSDSIIIVGADVGGMEILAVLGLLMGIAAVFLWFAVVVRGPCASMPLKLRLAYVWTGRVGERERRSPRGPVHDPDAVHIDRGSGLGSRDFLVLVLQYSDGVGEYGLGVHRFLEPVLHYCPVDGYACLAPDIVGVVVSGYSGHLVAEGGCDGFQLFVEFSPVEIVVVSKVADNP